METSSSPDYTSRQDQVAHEESENKINDSASVAIIGETTSGYKNELHVIDQQPPQINDAVSTLDSGAILEDDAQVDTLKSSEPDSGDLDYDNEDECKRKMEEVIGDESGIQFKSFKQFDTVEDYSDHFYANKKIVTNSQTGAMEKISVDVVKKPTKEWAKRIQHEWNILEKDLPETIFVRVYENRMDLLRAVIIGAAGTPYQDGLFFFDVQFPSSYPNDPPSVHYLSGGLQINPNLYGDGRICLSLLGTSSGEGCEKWQPSYSTMLQVLVSIQALVLIVKPYLNKPSSVILHWPSLREKMALKFNGRVFMLSCKAMMYSLRNPPKNFEDLVAGHFRKRGRAILEECKAYMDGDKGEGSSSSDFRCLLQKVFEDLLVEFTTNGAADCAEFLAHYSK